MDVPLAGVPAYELRAQPLPPGVIHVSAAFEGREFSDPDRVSVSTDVTLAGDPVGYPSPGQLADAALSTPGFIEALEMVPDTQTGNPTATANVSFLGERSGQEQDGRTYTFTANGTVDSDFTTCDPVTFTAFVPHDQGGGNGA